MGRFIRRKCGTATALLVKQLWDAAMGHTVGIIGRHRNLAFWILSIERRFEQFVSVSKCKQDSQGFNLFFCNSLRGADLVLLHP